MTKRGRRSAEPPQIKRAKTDDDESFTLEQENEEEDGPALQGGFDDVSGEGADGSAMQEELNGFSGEGADLDDILQMIHCSDLHEHENGLLEHCDVTVDIDQLSLYAPIKSAGQLPKCFDGQARLALDNLVSRIKGAESSRLLVSISKDDKSVPRWTDGGGDKEKGCCAHCEVPFCSDWNLEGGSCCICLERCLAESTSFFYKQIYGISA